MCHPHASMDHVILDKGIDTPPFYQLEAYPVISGKPSPWALCTCWSDIESMLKAHPSIPQYFSITSTLYSIEGISILLRNLLLHPEIQYLFVWPSSPLSKTGIGTRGWMALQTLWANGISDGHEIIGTATAIHKEIDPSAVRGLIKKVMLIDASTDTIPQLIEKIGRGDYPTQPITRMACSFPPPTRDTALPLPSEEIGWLVRQTSVVQTWLLVLDRILRYGKVKQSTNTGSKQKELYGLENDKGENINLIGKKPEIEESLWEELVKLSGLRYSKENKKN